jgi:hypothetical protein
MDFRPTLAFAALLAVGAADVSGLLPAGPAPMSFSSLTLASATIAKSSPPISVKDAPPNDGGATTLQPESRLLLIRYVDGEFAKLLKSLPGGKKGFTVSVGKPVDKQKLSDALRLYGTAASEGDTVQITGIEFRPQAIVLEINGGSKKHFHWRQHLQVGVGNVSTPPAPVSGPPDVAGATLVLDYGKPLPDMSPDDLKKDLGTVMDFSRQHSSAVNWVDTLPPQFQQAIKDRRATVGMDSEMVIAAIGRPDKKVREKDEQGVENEDWIYGTPPGPVVFVTFVNDTVIRVKQFN